MAAAISSYLVGVHRHTSGGHVRWLSLEADSGRFRHFTIYFFEDDPDSLGYVNPDTGHVVPLLPIRDFDNMYQMLQTEKPVYVYWYSGDDNRIVWFQLCTSEEPLGEGPADHS